MTTTQNALRIVFTVEEAADRLGIGRTLMDALVTAGEVESVRIGRLRRIPTDALNSYVLRLRCCAHGPEAARWCALRTGRRASISARTATGTAA